MLLAVRVPGANDRGPLYMEQALAGMHQSNPGHVPLTLGFLSHDAAVVPFVRCPDGLDTIVRTQLYAAYPDCALEQLPAAALEPQEGEVCWEASVQFFPPLFPLKRFGQFEDALNRLTADPLTAVLAGLDPDSLSPFRGRIELTVRPAGHRQGERARRVLRKLASPFYREHERLADVYLAWTCSRRLLFRILAWLLGRFGKGSPATHVDALHASSSRLHEREGDLQAAADKLGRLLFAADIRVVVTGPAEAAGAVPDKVRAIAGAFGQFCLPRLATLHVSPPRRLPSPRRHQRHSPSLLSTEELATLWHPPTLTVRTPSLPAVESRAFPPPLTLPTPEGHPDLAILGQSVYRGERRLCGILPDDRLRHVVIQGKTGMGKSTLLHQLAASDIAAGRGVALIDPHGDLCEALVRTVPSHRTNDVVLFDAGDRENPLAFNVLACPDPALRPLVASGVLGAFRKLYGEFWGPRMEHILRNALLTVLELPDRSFLTLLRLLGDARFRTSAVAKVTDPLVRAFWQQEFAGLPPKFQAEAIAPIQNKLGHFVSSPLLRNIVGQPRNRLDLRAVMDDGRILLVNLSKGRIGDDASALLGSFLVTALQIAAMSRADMAESQRRDYFLYIDEFQNFATDSFATILSEARKYRLALTIANQYLAQMDDTVRSAVFGNVGTMIIFQVGAEDAEVIAQQLGGELLPQDMLALPRHQAYVRLLIDGLPSRPFSMQTLSPKTLASDPQRGEVIRRYSRQRYGRPVSTVEREIAAALTR